jgi:hypothetical protein
VIRPRWLSHLVARLLGYFWLPCAVCREKFAGFETENPTCIPIADEKNACVARWELLCPKCSPRVEIRVSDAPPFLRYLFDGRELT